MIINSDFKDYYDFLLNHENRDPSIVYERKQKSFRIYHPTHPHLREATDKLQCSVAETHLLWGLRAYVRQLEMYPRPYIQKHNIRTRDVELVLIAGRVFPAAIYVDHENRAFSSERVWDYQTPYVHFKDLRALRPYLFNNRHKGEWVVDLKIPEVNPEEGFPDEAAVYANKTLAPIVHVEEDWSGSLRFNLNPRLRQLHFPVHPAQVVQWLMQFMAPVDPQPVETEDKYRAQAHGFDKASFRREPGGPTRKRKKQHAE